MPRLSLTSRAAVLTLALGLATSALAQTPEAAAPAAGLAANPYGLAALWAQGDLVAKATLMILLVMSMGSWYIIFTKLAEQLRMGRQARAAQEQFWSAGSVKDRKSVV